MNARYLLSRLTLVFATLIAPVAANAVTYNYVGNNFDTVGGSYTTSNSVTGSFDIPAALPAGTMTDLSGSSPTFSFSDGVATRTNANSTICAFSVTTNASGALTNWTISVRELPTPALGNPMHLLDIFAPVPASGGFDLGGTFPAPATACGTIAIGGPFMSAGTIGGNPGTWSGGTAAPTNPQSIPLMPLWGLGILVMLMLGVVGRAYRNT